MHPYATDSSERRLVPIYIALLSVIVAFLLGNFLRHISFPIPWWVESPSILGIYGLFYHIFNKWLWNYSKFRKLGLVKLPNLNGSWKGNGTSSFNEHSEEFEVTITIKQDWYRISIIGEFEMSNSHSSSASLLIYDKTGTILNYSYTNEPSVRAIEDMEMHHGFTNLIFNPHDHELSGSYYSGRGRQNIGQLKLKKV